MIGYLSVSFYGPQLPRIKTSRLLLTMEISGAGFLLYMSYCKQTPFCLILQSVVSTLWMTTAVAAHMAILYTQIAENFPTEIRGLACAVVLLFGKLSGASAPFIEEYTKHMGVHVLVGCTLMALVALPMTGLLSETLGNKKMI